MLTVRKIPFDLSAAIRGETLAHLVADLGRLSAVFQVAANAWAEWGEMAIVYLRKKLNVLDDTEEANTFVVQEARHAAALHQISKQLFGAASHVRDPRLGRVPALAHPVMSQRFRLGEPGDPSFADDLRNIVLYVTALEATFALLSTAAAASVLETLDPGDASSPYFHHAPFFYVVFYHNAEEAEHSHVAWEYYERTYGPIASIRSELAAKVEDTVADLKAICLAIASRQGVPLDDREVDDLLSPMLAVFRSRIERFDLWSFQDSRRMFIRSWDDVWEPRFRAMCERTIAGGSLPRDSD